MLTWTILCVCMLAGFAAILSIVGAATMLAMWHDPATLEEWRRSGGLGEAFIDVPLMLIALGLTMGIPGAAPGKGMTRRVTLSG